MERKIGVIMNTDIRKRAAEKVEAITAKLDQALIKSRFDEPIDKAIRQFTHEAGCPITHEQFHKIITEFVVHIYDKGLNARWKVSAEPLGHAIDLLENHYQGTYGRGYIASAMDSNDAQEGGIDTVLNRLAGIIKDIEQQKYVKGVFSINMDPTDWHLKCEIVSILLEDYRHFLPEHLLECKPWELVSQIPTIMYRYICSDSALLDMLSYQGNPLTTGDLFSVGSL